MESNGVSRRGGHGSCFVRAPLILTPLISQNGRGKDCCSLRPATRKFGKIRPAIAVPRMRGPQSLEAGDQLRSISSGHGEDIGTYENLSSQETASDNTDVATIYGGSDDGGISGGSNGGYPRGPGDGAGEGEDSLPEDMRMALTCGALTKEALGRYYSSLKNPFLRLLLAIPAFRTRFLADSAFFFKLWVQELIGNGTQLAGEIAVRGKDIVHEMEYVASDLIVGTVIEAAFVWVLAPRLALPTAGNSRLAKYLSSLPANMFQVSSAVQSFTLSQRCVSFFYTAAQYGLMGFVGGIVGTAITYGLIEGRKLIDKSYKPERPLPAVLPNSVGWGAFMALSSNTRFQLVEGLELGVARLFASSPSIVNGGIVALRFANNYWGGVQFVQFFRHLGLHATGDEEHSEKPSE